PSRSCRPRQNRAAGARCPVSEGKGNGKGSTLARTLSIRVTDADREEWERLAGAEGKEVSEWCRERILSGTTSGPRAILLAILGEVVSIKFLLRDVAVGLRASTPEQFKAASDRHGSKRFALAREKEAEAV